MWIWIAKFFGHMPDPPERCPNTPEAGDTPAPESESSGVPEDSPAPQQPSAEPVPAAPGQGEVKPVRFPYPVSAPSRNGTHARH